MTAFIQRMVNTAFKAATNANMLDDVSFYSQTPKYANQPSNISSDYNPTPRRDAGKYENQTPVMTLDDAKRLAQGHKTNLLDAIDEKPSEIVKNLLITVKAAVRFADAGHPETPQGPAPDLTESVALTVTLDSLKPLNTGFAEQIQNGFAMFRGNKYQIGSVSVAPADGLIKISLRRKL